MSIWNASTIILNTTAFRHTASSEEFAIFDTEPLAQSRKHIPTLKQFMALIQALPSFHMASPLPQAVFCLKEQHLSSTCRHGMRQTCPRKLKSEVTTDTGRQRKKKNYSYCRVKTYRKRTLSLSVCQHRPLCSLCVNSISHGTI